MEKVTTAAHPLVSVIIPCYNHGSYLQQAVESATQQSYPAIEVIVVDDGSTDNTREVAAGLAGVKYIYQANQGLSAARNTGIAASKGEFLVFLDADDWLLPEAIATNARQLTRNEKLAFVSGSHDKVYVQESTVEECAADVASDHYINLLKGNYIGMHATVMYRRSIFNEVLFDTSLKVCEDYDLYLKIARRHEVFHHTAKIAAYRLHNTNMSRSIPTMLSGVLQILDRQRSELKTEAEKKAYRAGKHIWKAYYSKELYQKLLSGKGEKSFKNLSYLLSTNPSLFIKYLLRSRSTMIKQKIKALTPPFGLSWLHSKGFYKKYIPGVNKVRFGDFYRTQPFSRDFGYDRGGPIDRFYIENFLGAATETIKGRVLEIGDNEYTLRFGGSKVSKSDILHVDASNPNATFVGDISNAPHIPDALFDSIILTQTLHLIYDVKGALITCHRILKPGGTLLLTVPGITPIDRGEWKDTWYWSFTENALARLFKDTFQDCMTDINTHGNVFAATAFLFGMGLPEVPIEKLEKADPQFPVIVTVKATKAQQL